MSVGNQVEKPRFFVDLLQYQYEIGNIRTLTHHDSSNSTDGKINHELIGLKPIKKYSSAVNNHEWKSIMIGFKNPISIPTSDMFISCLGHKFADVNYKFVIGFVPVDDGYLQHHYDTGNVPGFAWGNHDYINKWEYLDHICNSSGTTHSGIPEFNGWSIAKFTPGETADTVQENIAGIRILIVNQDFDTDNPVDWGWDIGGISVGMIYEPEFHADLAVTQSRIMDGVKNKKTKGGSTYSVVNYTKPADWWTGNPFELTSPSSPGNPGSTPQVGARLGRRSWDVAFSQLSDRFYTDGVPNGVFPANEMINKFNPDSVNGNYLSDQDYDSSSGMFNYNMENDNSLYSTLYHHTLGGTLPFIFSPSQDNSPQNFAICRFDKPGFKVTQKSYKKFNVKMKIHESW